MSLEVEFGKCLKILLDAADISGSKLAKAINVDPSLISRWVNCKKVPSNRSPYIKMISDYISKSIVNSYQLNRINDILNSLAAESVKCDGDLACSIKSLLLEAQGYSLNKNILSPNIKKLNKNHAAAGKTQLNNDPYDNSTHCSVSKKISDALFETSERIPLSSEDYVMVGCENVLDCANKLLNQALMSTPSKQPIMITINSKFSLLALFEEYHHEYRKKIVKLLKNGWTVITTIKFDDTIERSHRFLEDTMLFLKSGNYLPYLSNNIDHSSALSDMIIVPDIGALVFLCTKSVHQLDFSFLFKNSYAIDAFIGKFHQAIKYSHPVLYEHKSRNWMELVKSMTVFEESPGNRYTFRDGISAFLVSENIYEESLKSSESREDEMRNMLSYHKKQMYALDLNQNFYKYKDIFLTDSIERAILNKKKQDCELSQSSDEADEALLILECLDTLIDVYRNSDNYEIALIDEKLLKTYKGIFTAGMNFYLKRNHSIIHILNRKSKAMSSEDDTFKFVCLSEPTITYALEKAYLDIWNRIAPVNKDRREVLAWLNHLKELVYIAYNIKNNIK